MELMSIASGSSGNSIYIGNDHTTLLCDCGISMKRIEAGLNSINRTLSDLDGILITHEHDDHIKSLGAISRKYHIPIYATEGTIKGIKQYKSLGNIDYDLFVPIETDKAFTINDIDVYAHNTWHDTYEPCCYSLVNDDKKISIATDLGDYDEYLVDKLKDSDCYLLEANHDIRMLELGKYPYPLKQRILGKYGHLSNEASGRLLLSLLNDHIKGIILGHLSKENNFPELALEAVKCEISENPFTKDLGDFNIEVASRNECGKLICV